MTNLDLILTAADVAGAEKCAELADKKAGALLSRADDPCRVKLDEGKVRNHAEALKSFAATLRAAIAAVPAQVATPPIDMILLCPSCGDQHIDSASPPDWTNPPHRSHRCWKCGHVWRPADVATNGVVAITTKGKEDDEPPSVPLTQVLDDLKRAVRLSAQSPTPAQTREAVLEKALEEIAKGEGEFNRDPLVHASNCIDNMKKIARDALATTVPIQKTGEK